MASLCNICLVPYNRNTHKEIKCEKCNFICCKTCIKILFTNNIIIDNKTKKLKI